MNVTNYIKSIKNDDENIKKRRIVENLSFNEKQ